MQIRQAVSADIPEIINLLKISMGEALLPKSEAYFLWKHMQNPFGQSKILLSEEDGKITGLRAFMRWTWVSASQTISAVRAVDTATHPDYQGKGIFRKLTLQAVEECKQEGIDLVFNSPNPKSMAGYLKMGWHTAGRMPVYFGIGSMIPGFFSEKTNQLVARHFDIAEQLKKLPATWSLPKSDKALHTPLDYRYIQWRYSQCPVASYGALIDADKFGIIFRVKKINRFIELRICETWIMPGSNGYSAARKALRNICKTLGPIIITCAPSPLFSYDTNKMLGLFGPFKKGPVTTIRPLKMTDLSQFNLFNHWQPSMGSMELF